LKKIEIACPPLAEAGKKEGGWGEGIFARPRFSAAAEFRASVSWHAAFKFFSFIVC